MLLRTTTLVIVALLASAAAERAAAQSTTEPYTPPGYGTAAAPVQTVTVVPGAPVAPAPIVGMQPVPPAHQARLREVERSEAIRGLWLPGVITLPIAWLATFTAASTSLTGDAYTYSWIPVIGPWLMLTQNLNGYDGAAIFSGVVQSAAALAIILGLSIRRTWREMEYVVEPAPGVQARVSLTPLGLRVRI
jgi:hypothetical protein